MLIATWLTDFSTGLTCGIFIAELILSGFLPAFFCQFHQKSTISLECVSAWFIFVPDSKLLSNMKLKSLLIRFAAVSFAAVMALGCGQEKPIDPDLPEEKDPTQTEGTTIADVLKAEVGGTFEVENVLVVGANTNGVLLQQMGSYIYAFKGSEHNLQVGDLLKVSGTTSSRNGLIQFGSGCTLEKTGTAPVAFPTPEPMDADAIEAYMSDPSIKYVTDSGTVLLSGNYTNLEIDGSPVVGSLDYMTEEFRTKYSKHNVTITGWLFGSYKTYMYTIPVEVKDNGIPQEDVPDGAIYYNTFDADLASQTFGDGGQWPYLDQFEGWKNEKGSGASAVTYDFKSVSCRTNQSSKGDLSQYDGSGKNNIFFSTAPAHLTIGNIAVSGKDLRLSFGAQRYSQGASNAFIKSDFEVRLSADGEIWSQALDYSFGEVEDVPGEWRLATVDFTLPDGVNSLYIKFIPKMSSVNRIDDVLLVSGNGGELVEFGKEESVETSSIAKVLDSPIDEVYQIEGTVVGTHSKGFLVKDDTGIILTFKKNHGMETGDVVTVKGATSVYGGLKQFGETSEVTKTGTASVSYPEPEEFGAADIEGYVSAPCIKYVKYKGFLTSYQDNIYQWHYDVAVDGTDVVASLSYPNTSLNVTSYLDRNVIVTGYAIGVTGSDTKYLNTLVTSIEFAEKEECPDESKAITVKELNERLASMESGAALADLVAVKGYVAANNEGGALYQVISLVDNTGEPGTGIILKGEDYTEATLPVGTKVIVSLKYATYDLYKNLPQVKKAMIFPTDSKAEIVVPEIADNQCRDYLGQYVKVRNLTAPDDATTWVVNNKTTTTRFTGENGETVATYVTRHAVYKDEKIAHKTSWIKGVMEVYGDLHELIPTSMEDVSGFKE